jgi:hypothetical protein
MPALLALLGLNWRVALPIAAALALGLGAYAKGFHDAASACRAREIAEKLAVAQATIRMAEAAKADAESKAASLDQQSTDLQQKVTAYEDALRKVILPQPVPDGSHGACRLDDDGARRLRAIGP